MLLSSAKLSESTFRVPTRRETAGSALFTPRLLLAVPINYRGKTLGVLEAVSRPNILYRIRDHL
jgi:hypothetical protein